MFLVQHAFNESFLRIPTGRVLHLSDGMVFAGGQVGNGVSLVKTDEIHYDYYSKYD
jgi:hypothetical protein